MEQRSFFLPTQHADKYLKEGTRRCIEVDDGDYASRAAEIENAFAEYDARQRLQRGDLPLFDERSFEIERDYFVTLCKTLDHARQLLVASRSNTLEAVFELSVEDKSVIKLSLGCPGGNRYFPLLGVPLEVNLRDTLQRIHVDSTDVRTTKRMATIYRFNVPVIPFPPAPTKFLAWDVPTA